MKERIFTGAAIAALAIAFTVALAFSQTMAPRQHRVQGPGEDCNLDVVIEDESYYCEQYHDEPWNEKHLREKIVPSETLDYPLADA